MVMKISDVKIQVVNIYYILEKRNSILIETRATPTRHNTPVDFHKGRHVLREVTS